MGISGEMWIENVRTDYTLEARIERLQQVVPRLLDLLIAVIPIHETNRVVAFSDVIHGQLPVSHAANGYNTMRSALLDVEMSRLIRLWDRPSWARNSLQTAYWLAADPDTRRHFDDEWRCVRGADAQSVEEQAERRRRRWSRLDALAPKAFSAPLLERLSNYRDKHLAHSLESTRREAVAPIGIPTYRDQHKLLRRSIVLSELINLCVRESNFYWRGSFEIAEANANAFWGSVRLVDVK